MTELILSNIFFSILGFPSIFLISVVTFYVIKKKNSHITHKEEYKYTVLFNFKMSFKKNLLHQQ